MENNNKGSQIFLGVIGVATLIVAIIGATFAFFGAQITGGEGNLTVSSTTLALGFEDDKGDNLKTNLIPAEYWIAEYAATNEEYLEDNDQCIDENGNEVCGVYTFSVGNPSTTTTQTLYASVNVTTNDFEDLWFRIYDENGDEVVEPTKFTQDGSIALDELTQTLLASNGNAAEGKTWDDATPSTYELVTATDTNGKTTYNKRSYTMVIWIEETQTDQTENNAGKTFAGSLYFTTASGTSGVTGVIAAAQKADNDADNPDGSNYPAGE